MSGIMSLFVAMMIIIPVEELKDDDAQKIVIFDDFICEKKPENH